MDENNEIAKKIIKKAIMAVAKPLIIGILIFAIVIISLSSILNFLTVFDGTSQDSDWSNVPYAKSQYVKDVSIDDDGYITTKMSVEELWDKLIKNHSRIDQYLSNADELKKLLNAELITDYLDPNTENSIDESKKIKGIIKLKRAMPDGKTVTMQYAKPEEFQGNLDRYNSRGNYEDGAAKEYLLTHFTIDKEISTNKSDSDKTSKDDDGTDNNTSSNTKYYAEVATWTSEETTLTSTDPEVESSVTKKYTMTTTKINYQDLVSGYTMPFEYLWAFLLVGQEKEFVLELADLVYNSEIEITVHDNLIINTNTETDEYTKKTKVVTKDVNVDVSYHTAAGADDPASPTKAQGTQIKTNSKMEEPRSIEQTKDYKVVRTEKTTTNSLDTCVTKANTWVVNYTKEYHQVPEPQRSTGDNENEYGEEYPSTPDHTDNVDTAGIAEAYRQEIEKKLKEKLYSNISTNITSLTSEYYYSTKGKKSIRNTTESSKYVASPGKTEEKTDKDSDEPNFVTIYRKKEHQKNASNINSAPEWLFQILEKNDSTKDSMVDLTKYLLYKATGKDYGVKEFNFGIFDADKFNSVSLSGKSILKEYIRYWEHSSPPPTNANGTKYIIEDDGAGNPTVGYGIDIENSGYKQLFIDAGYPTTIGGEVDIEFVDSLEDKKIEEVLAQVKSKTEGLDLTGYQINVLASRAFNCGVSGALDTLRGEYSLDFKESYKKYWNQDKDDKFEEKDSNADYEHSLYTQYMSKPVTAKNGQYMPGLERRRKSEWRLFQTGYYDVLDKWHSSMNFHLKEIVEDFVERTNGHDWDIDKSHGGQCWDLWAKFCVDNGLNFNYNTGGYRLCLWCISYV